MRSAFYGMFAVAGFAAGIMSAVNGWMWSALLWGLTSGMWLTEFVHREFLDA